MRLCKHGKSALLLKSPLSSPRPAAQSQTPRSPEITQHRNHSGDSGCNKRKDQARWNSCYRSRIPAELRLRWREDVASMARIRGQLVIILEMKHYFFFKEPLVFTVLERNPARWCYSTVILTDCFQQMVSTPNLSHHDKLCCFDMKNSHKTCTIFPMDGTFLWYRYNPR